MTSSMTNRAVADAAPAGTRRSRLHGSTPHGPSRCSEAGFDVDEGFEAFRRTRSRRLRNLLVEAHADLARRCTLRYAGRGEYGDDLRQVALIGLIKAVEGFDPAMGVPFASYARPTIDGEIKRYFRDRTWRVSVPRRTKDLRAPVHDTIERLRQRDGRSPTPDEVAAELGIAREQVLDTILANQVYRCLPLDVPGADLPSRRSAGEDQSDARVLAVDAIRRLGERERCIIVWRFYEECTQAQIGDRLGVGQVQVSRLLRAALEQLREHLATPDPDGR